MTKAKSVKSRRPKPVVSVRRRKKMPAAIAVRGAKAPLHEAMRAH
jgi:hypothetical protein